MGRVILLLAGLGLLAATLALRTAHGRRFARLTGPRKCGDCAHLLAPGQDRCPECAREWGERDPGAARVFGAAADRCERARRTVLVTVWGLLVPGGAAVVLGALYATGALPWAPATNAWWSAPVQVPVAGEAWEDGDVELLMLVHGSVAAQDGFEPGAPMERIDEVIVVLSNTAERTAPATGTMERLDGSEGVIFRRRGSTWSVEANQQTARGEPSTQPPWMTSMRHIELLEYQSQPASEDPYYAWWISYPLSLSSPKFSQHDGRPGKRTCNLVAKALLGADMRGHIRWGEKHSGFTPPDVAAGAASTRQQFALVAIAAGLAATVLLMAWTTHWRGASGRYRGVTRYGLAATTKPFSA